MNILQTIILAIVEGLTEFLPVSSTGHMIIAQKFLGIPSTDFVKAFTVIIQFGAILSVVVLYWQRFFQLNPCKIMDKKLLDGKSGGERYKIIISRFLYKYDFYWKLFIAFLPAAFIGFIFGDLIDSFLENIYVVASTLVIGGVVMLYVDKWFNKVDPDQSMTTKRAISIGFFQCIAMIPGVSRSMATIVGGMIQKLDRKNAAEFSFFLAVPTMFAATAYKLLKLLLDPTQTQILIENIGILILGNVVAFIVALLAIRFFIGYVTRYGFKAFGIYRIVVGVFLLALLMMGYNLEII
ncbi:MAG: undecaprenyl-diphosphate phosphatase [Bacteroidales bacterium]